MGVAGRPKNVLEGSIKDNPEMVTVDELAIKVTARDGSNPLHLKKVFVQPENMFNMPSRPHLETEKHYPHLEGLEFAAVKAEDIGILIGSNAPTAHLYDDCRVAGDDDPVALKTRFGWTLFGPSVHSFSEGRTYHSNMITNEVIDDAMECFWETEDVPTLFTNKLSICAEDASLHTSVERFWKEEHYGILPQRDLAMSRVDMEAMETLEEKTQLANNRYVVPMLWAKPDVPLPHSLPMALKRYASLLRKQRANQEFNEKSQAIVAGYLQADPPQARKMTPEEAQNNTLKTWTLPIHPVINPNKPGKVRLCNDAAAEFHGISLNKRLEPGPDILNSLVGVLLRYRVGDITIAADIEAMFHQVRICAEDAEALRFLWKEDITSNDPPDTY